MKRLTVMPEKCASCIFGPNTPIPPERFAELRAQWEARGNETFQVCHQTGAWDVDDPDDEPPEEYSVCRGFYDEMVVRRGLPVAIIQIAERLGFLDVLEPSA